MPLSFRQLALAVASLCFALCATWLLMPGTLLTLWGIDTNPSAELVGRRVACLFLGLGLMLFRTRDAAPSASRSALSNSFTISGLSLAAMGIYELLAGHAGPGILSAVTVELAMAIGFFAVERKDAPRLPASA